jgi:hypothetical protein
VLGLHDVAALVGETVVALSHEPYRQNIGAANLDVVTNAGAVYRFATEGIPGERTAGGWTMEHYSLTLERLNAGTLENPQTPLAGTIVKAYPVQCDEWLGPIDKTIASVGSNPRKLLDGKLGSCPSGATCVTVVCGAVLQSDDWQLLVRTHPFADHLDFTTDRAAIDEFLKQYSVDRL